MQSCLKAQSKIKVLLFSHTPHFYLHFISPVSSRDSKCISTRSLLLLGHSQTLLLLNYLSFKPDGHWFRAKVLENWVCSIYHFYLCEELLFLSQLLKGCVKTPIKIQTIHMSRSICTKKSEFCMTQDTALYYDCLTIMLLLCLVLYDALKHVSSHTISWY